MNHPMIAPLLAALLCLGLVSPNLLAQEEAQQQTEKEQPEEKAKAETNKRAMIISGLGSEAIARSRPDHAVWLTAEENGRVLAMFQQEQEPPAKGALVILADEGQSAASGLAEALREPLSEGGWAVMTLGLEPPSLGIQQLLKQRDNAPPEEEMPAQEKEESGGQGEQASSEESVMIDVMENSDPVAGLEQYRSRVASSLGAAVGALREREYERVVLVGIGWAAGHVTRHVREDGRASDMIWIAPKFHVDESGKLPEMLGSAASPSILELYSTFPNDKVSERSSRERASALKRAGISGYDRQPVAMARRPEAREAKKLANRMAAWLSPPSDN